MDLAQSRPRFRTDLVAQPLEEAGQRFVDVTDPDSGRTFRFYDVEYSIACAMDGLRDIPRLADWAEAELGVVPKPSAEELRRVISTLADLGYLAMGPSIEPGGPAGRSIESGGPAAPLVTDLSLGHAGATDPSAGQPMPQSPDLELGFAGNEGMQRVQREAARTPDVGLGHAGNEGLPMAPSLTGDEDLDDNEPTKIKKRSALEAAPVDLPPPPPVGEEAQPEPVLQRTTEFIDDEEGPTALPPPAGEFEEEVSVDLTDHLKLGPDAVKEAVRQSKMFSSVSESTAGAGDEAARAAPPPMPPVRPPATELPDHPPATARPLDPSKTAAKPTARPAVAMEAAGDRGNQSGKAFTGKGTPSKEPRSNTGLLLVMLLLILIGAGAAEYFLGIIGLREMLGLGGEPPPAKTPVTDIKPVKDPPPKKPSLPSAVLEVGEGESQDVMPPREGTLSTIVPSGTQVQVEAVVAKLKGVEAIEGKITDTENREEVYRTRLERSQAKLEEAEKSGDAGAIKKAKSTVAKNQAKVDEKRTLIEGLEKQVEGFLIRAPVAGTVETTLKANDFVKADAPIFTVQGEPSLKAVFNVPADKSIAVEDEVEVVSKIDDKKRLACKVIAVEGTSVTVDCPADGGVDAGVEVVLP